MALKLWSKLESAGDVTSPQIGTGGAEVGSPTYPAAKFGNGILSDIDNEGCTFPTGANSINLNKGTIEFWAKMNWIQTTGAHHNMFSFYSAGSGGGIYLLFDANIDDFTVAVYSGGAKRVDMDTVGLSWNINDLLHFAVTWDREGNDIGSSKTIALYINNSEVISSTITWDANDNWENLVIGTYTGGSLHSDAVIDNLKTYDVVKTDFSDRGYEGIEETFGKTTKGASDHSLGDVIMMSKYTSGSAGPLKSLSVYALYQGVDNPTKCAIYDASFNLLTNGITEEKSVLTGQDGWMEFDFLTPPEVAAATEYYLAFWSKTYAYYYRDPDSAASKFMSGVPWDGWPDPFVEDGVNPNDYSIFATYAENQAPTAPTSLLCEGASSPVTNVADLTPEFSAIFNDPDSGDIANAVQIQVGTTPGASDMWDSGWIDISGESLAEGNRCNDQSYAGSALSLDGSTYYWRCRFRDDDNEEGVYSANVQFTMQAPAPPPVTAVGGLLSQIW